MALISNQLSQYTNTRGESAKPPALISGMLLLLADSHLLHVLDDGVNVLPDKAPDGP